MDITQFIFSVVCGWALGYFQFGNITTKATMNFHIAIFVWIYVSLSLGQLPMRGIARLYGNSVLSLGNARLFSKVDVPLYIPTLLHFFNNICYLSSL